MIMKNYILFGLVLLVISCTSPINQEKENTYGEPILVGTVNWDGLTAGEYGAWFVPTYKNYKVDEGSLAKLEPVFNDLEITVFLGTWCEDSQVQVPQFYRMMDHLGYDIATMEVIGLERLENRDLVGPAGEEVGMNITHVPTFIFYKDGEEIGRIVEYPRRTIEKDMVEIILGE
jgi:thiol-disulfide isomerase/thioredoxin